MPLHRSIQSKRRRRTGNDEQRLRTSGDTHESARSLGQSFDLLRHPQTDQATRSAAVSNLQQAVGNTQVTRVLAQREQAEIALQRYPVDVAEDASCDEVIRWIDANSPYAPEWAHTQGNLRWRGSFRITGSASDGYRLRVGNPQVMLDGPHVDMPEWQPANPAMRSAWQRAYRTLRAHEARHETIARRWQRIVQRRLARLNLRVNAASREEVEAQAESLISAEWDAWIAEYQAAQQAIDPFNAPLECPNP